MNVLIFRIGSIGDTIASLPCFHEIRRQHPNSKVTLLTNLPNDTRGLAISSSEVLNNSNLVDATINYRIKVISIELFKTLRIEVKRNNISLAYYLMPFRSKLALYRDYAFLKLIGIKRIYGISLFSNHTNLAQRLGINAHQNSVNPNFEPEYQRLYRLTFPNLSPSTLTLSDFNLNLQNFEIQAFDAKFSNISMNKKSIAISIASKSNSDIKDWGKKNWKKLIREMSVIYPEFTLIAIGADSDKDIHEEILKCWSGNRVNFCGILSVRESAIVLSRCKVMICNDSGPMHLGAIVGLPVISLFSNENKPGIWYPWGNEKNVIRVLGDAPLTSIAPKLVLDKLNTILL